MNVITAELQTWMDDRKANGLWHVCYDAKFRDLTNWLETHRPKVIVELGSGLTTGIFDEYAEQTDAMVVTVDLPQWIAETSKYLIHGNVRFIPAELEDKEKYRRYKFDYQLLPDPIDLLYVDGPDLIRGTKVGIDAGEITAVKQVKGLLFDLRWTSALHCICRPPMRYRLKHLPHHYWLRLCDIGT